MSASHPPLTEDDVESTTVGIRPLVVDEGKDSYTTSRRHELYDHSNTGVRHLWSIGGGKWTTGRALGEETVRTLLRSEALKGVPTRKFDSRRVAAFGAFGWAEEPEPYLGAAANTRPALGLAPEVRLHLARLYGTAHERVLDLVERDPALGERLSDRPGRHDIAAQAVFAVTDESAMTLSDVIDRRLVLGTLGEVSPAEVERVAAVVAPLFGWSLEEAAAHAATESARRAALRARWRGLAPA